jgi:RimJ/RimL family protein N-acetyltransferase
MNIKGKFVTLRAIEECDLELLHRWANDPDLQAVMGNIHFPSSMDFHKAWFAGLKNDPLNQRFAIDAPEIGLIGLSTIINIDWRNNHAFHGIMLGDKDIRHKGYGFDAVLATMRYAFDELHLERLDGQIIEYNQTPYHLYCEKLGWKEEGRRRNWIYTKGRYWNQILVGITRQDYLELLEGMK